MKRVIRASQGEELVNLLARTTDGKWVEIFHDIPESQAREIWTAGFKTGENNFSIDTETGRRIQEQNRKAMGLDK